MNKKSKKKQKKPDKASEANFKEGDLVGAKVKGHPIWPGWIEEVNYINNKRRYTVRFFGSNDTSQSCMEIKLFKKFTNKEKACSRKGFKEAFLECQKKYHELLKDSKDDLEDDDQEEEEKQEEEEEEEEKQQKYGEKEIDREELVEEENSVPDKRSSDSSESRETEKCVIDHDKDGIGDIKSDKESFSSPSNAITPMESDYDEAIIAKVKNIAKEDTIQTKSPKSEGENVAEAPKGFDSTLAKLEGKVAKKLEEKEACKIKEKERRISSKVSKKLAVINKTLKSFSKTVKELSNAKPINQSNIDEWKSAVRRYDSAFPILNKCIKYYLISENDSTKYGISDNYRECQKILIEIISDVKGAIKNPQTHDNLKKEMKKFRRNIKVNPEIKEFINQQEPGTFKNAMIERRDNDAEL